VLDWPCLVALSSLTRIYTLSLHDALPISNAGISVGTSTESSEDLSAFRKIMDTNVFGMAATFQPFVLPMILRKAERSSELSVERSEEHTSELQSRVDLVCRLLLVKKKVRS